VLQRVTDAPSVACTKLQCVAVCSSVLQFDTVCGSVLHSAAVSCSELRCVVACCRCNIVGVH